MLEYLINDDIVQKEDRIAVGVSGGADSMLLLWALLDKQKQIGFYLKVININHHIRGKESDDDSLFVADFCKKKNIPCEVVDVDAKKLKTQEKLSLEESARKLRYDSFYKIMKKEKLNKLFLAHHKNDQAETILMHILRGAGLLGACGIKDDKVIKRPLLNLSKQEILQLCVDYGIKFVVDSSNNENDATRNYIRNVVFPEIEKVYPSAVDAVCAFGDKCKEFQVFIENQVKPELFEEGEDFVVLKDAAFVGPNFLVREYLRIAFLKMGVFADVEAKHYELATKLVQAEVNKTLDFPHGIEVKRTYGGIKLMKKVKNPPPQTEWQFVIGKLEFEGYGTIETKFVSPDAVVYGNGVLYADYAKISNNAVWRARKLGDKFSKFGTGSKKLNDYFTDEKVEVEKRDFVPVLANGNQIYVVAGLEVSEKAKIDGDTDQIVQINFYPKG